MPSSNPQSSSSGSWFASSAFRGAAFCVLVLLIIGGGIGIWLEMQPNSENRIALFDGKQFTPDELVQIEAALAKKNLSDYTIVNQTLEIPAKSRSVYVAALAEANALPQESGRTLEKAAVDISLFDSPEVRNLKIKAAQQKDLADIINSIEGVSSASVLWDTEKQGGLNPKTIVRASVSLKSVPGYALDNAKIDAICRLTANAIAGLKTENVVIVDTRTGACYTQSAASSSSLADNTDDSPERVKDPALAKRLTAERFWNKKISELVRASVENAIVQTTVEISDCQSETQRRIEHDPEPTIYRSEVIEDLTPAVFGINQPANNSDLNRVVPQPEPTSVLRKTEEGVLGGKEIVTQEDLPYIVSDVLKHDVPTDKIQLLSYMVTTSYGLKPLASIKVSINGNEYAADSTGDGQYDAFVKALRKIYKDKLNRTFPILANYSVSIPPGGRTDALVQTIITWRYADKILRTRGLDADQTEAAIKATFKMLNIFEESLTDTH